MEEIGEIETAAEDPVLVDVEDRVSGEGRVGWNVAMVEDGNQQRSSLQRIPRYTQCLLRFGWSWPPRLGPNGVPRDLKRNRRDRKVQRGAEVEPSAAGSPVRETGTDGHASGENGSKVRWENEPELSLRTCELGVGETLLHLYA